MRAHLHTPLHIFKERVPYGIVFLYLTAHRVKLHAADRLLHIIKCAAHVSQPHTDSAVKFLGIVAAGNLRARPLIFLDAYARGEIPLFSLVRHADLYRAFCLCCCRLLPIENNGNSCKTFFHRFTN